MLIISCCRWAMHAGCMFLVCHFKNRITSTDNAVLCGVNIKSIDIDLNKSRKCIHSLPVKIHRYTVMIPTLEKDR